MVFQDWALFPHLTVAQNVAFGLDDDEATTRVDEVLEMVGMTGLRDRYPDSLSGGQMQRVALARALAPHPRLLLFDEPFSNLDTRMRIKVRSDIAALMREVGITSVFVTHDQEEAFVLGDRVSVMRDGAIVQSGTPTEIYHHPATPWVASFVGDANVLVGAATGWQAETPVGVVALAEPLHGPCRVVVRPEHLVLESGYDALVTATEFYGHDTSHRVTMGEITLQVRAIGAPCFAVGDRVSVSYRGPAAVAFPLDSEAAA